MSENKEKNLQSLKFVFCMSFAYMLAEFIGGYFTNSLTLMADAVHMFGDVFSLGLAFFAINLSLKKTSIRKTFGYYRAEILAAFINGLSLILISIWITIEAYHRFMQTQQILGGTMLIIAIGGLIINIIGVKILHSGSKNSINVKAAFMHIIADLLGSIGAIVAAILVYFFNFYIADIIISFVIALLVFISSIGIIKSTTDILMESVPANINIQKVKEKLQSINGVVDIYDFHIWSINMDCCLLIAHIKINTQNQQEILHQAKTILQNDFNILHSTIQIEVGNFTQDKCIFTKQV